MQTPPILNLQIRALTHTRRNLSCSEPHSAVVVARRYSKQQAYLILATAMLDLVPERKEAHARMKKLEKLQKALSDQERLEEQVWSEGALLLCGWE